MLCVARALLLFSIIAHFCATNSAVEVRVGHRLIKNYKVAFENPVKNAINVRQLQVEEATDPVKVETIENQAQEEEENIDYEDLDEGDLLELLISEYGANEEEDLEEAEAEETLNQVEPVEEEEDSNFEEDELLQLLQTLGIQLDGQTGRATIPLRRLRRRLSRIPRRLLRRFIREFL